MAEHSKNARPSTHDKHTNRDKGHKSKSKKSDNWVDLGKRTNSERNQNRKK